MDLNNAGDLYEDIFIKNRILNVQNTVSRIYAKLREVFRYEGLPLTLPKRILEGALLKTGGAVVYEYEGNLFVSDARPGGKTNLYDENVEVTIEHRNAGGTERLTRNIGVDAVFVRNDSENMGVDDLVTEYAVFMAQAKITMLGNFTNLRNPVRIHAKDENSYRSGLEYEKALRRGDTAILMAEEFDTMEGIEALLTPIGTNTVTQTIEQIQYIQSFYYSEFGINLNNNMKREYVSESEMEKSSGMPLIINMLASREEAVRDIKALFGVDITVTLSNEWDDEQEADNDEALGAEGEEPEGTDGDEQPGEPEPEAEAEEPGEEPEGEDADEAVAPEPREPEVEEVSAEELIEATEALLGEEVEHDEEADGDSAADDPDPESDSGTDEESGSDVEAEEDDDEGR